MSTQSDEQQIKRFFPHDECANSDPKIIKLRKYFDTHQKDFPLEVLQSLLPITALGVFWRLVEYMHIQNLPVDEIETLAYDFGIPSEFLQTILNKFGLFYKETDVSGIEIYVSDRILRNKKFVQDKSGKQKEAADFRWLMSAFNKEYESIFGEKPNLTKQQIKTLKAYSENIDNLKEILPDIFYTMSLVTFDNNIKPRYPWLLQENKDNLGKIISGEIGGGLKHKKTEEEISADQQKEEEKEKAVKKLINEEETIKNAVCDKETAIKHLLYRGISTVKTLNASKMAKDYMIKYNIAIKDVIKAAEVQDV